MIIKPVRVIVYDLVFLQWLSDVPKFHVYLATNFHLTYPDYSMGHLVDTMMKIFLFYSSFPNKNISHGMLILVGVHIIVIDRMLSSFDALVYLYNFYSGIEII